MENNIDIFIGTHKTFMPKVKNKTYKIVVGNHQIENNSNLELIECGNENDALDDRFFSEIYMFKKLCLNKYPFKKYVGFCHYRKYWEFMDDIPNMDEIFSKCDVVMVKPIKMNKNIYEQYGICHNIEDLDIIKTIINNKFSNFSESFNKVMKSHIFFPYNMFIMKREDFLEYIDFVANVLDEYINVVGVDIKKRIEDNKEKYLKKFYPNNTFEYQYRLGGYLAERLTNVFIAKKFNKIMTYNVILTEKKYNKFN